MLPTKILKLRLSRIQKGESHLSTQDKLILVTSERPDLSAGFLLRLLQVSLPRQWKFRHAHDEDIACAIQLIRLIEDEFITAYSTHARKYGWYEQCLRYRLTYVQTQPTQQHINGYLRQLEQCLDRQPKIDLLHHLHQYQPSVRHANALASAYAGAGQYTPAIEYFEWAAAQATHFSEVAFYAYIECLLKRNQPEYRPRVSDVEYALDLLIRYQKPLDQKAYDRILQQAVDLILPEAILQTRATATSLVAELGRGLNTLGQSLNGLWGGREYDLPFSAQVIASAPRLLTGSSCNGGLAPGRLYQALQAYVEQACVISLRQQPALLETLWQGIQQQPAILEWLLQPAPAEQVLEKLTRLAVPQQHVLQSETIQFILQQGWMTYLGEGRIDKQHPQRALLYAQHDRVVEQMLAFAEWFYTERLSPYLEQQTQLTTQIRQLCLQSAATTCSSGLFAIQFEVQKRAQALAVWMHSRLQTGNRFAQMQVAWVALRELPHLGGASAQAWVQALEQALAQYKSLRSGQLEQVRSGHKETD